MNPQRASLILLPVKLAMFSIISKCHLVALTDSFECCFTDDISNTELEQLKSLLVVTSEQSCSPDIPAQPLILATIFNYKFCAILDTGTELSLVTQGVINKFLALPENGYW